MKSTARSRRHKTVEPIDFRELLDAPALNGLKEALAHRRESEADVPSFPSPPTIAVHNNEPTAVGSSAPESAALESSAVYFREGDSQTVHTRQPREFRQQRQIEELTASEPTAVTLLAEAGPARDPSIHKTEPVGVVLIGVDTELQARMRSEFPAPPAPHSGMPNSEVPEFGIPHASEETLGGANSDVPDIGVPDFGEHNSGAADLGEPNSITAPVPHSGIPNSGVPEFGIPHACEETLGESQSDVPNIAVPDFGEHNSGTADLGGSNSITAPVPHSGMPNFDTANIGTSKFGTGNHGHGTTESAPPDDQRKTGGGVFARYGPAPGANRAQMFGRLAEESAAPEPRSDEPEFGVPIFGTRPEDEDTGEFNLDHLIQRRTGKKTYVVHPATRIENIFSAGEQSLLRWYWEQGRPVPGQPSARIVAGTNGEGSRRMAAQAGLVWNTFRNYTRSLSTKFAIDVVRPAGNSPRLYVIWHYSAILERIRRAGFTGVVHKSGGGRELVDDQSRPAHGREDLNFQELKLMFGTTQSGTQKSGMPNYGSPNSLTPSYVTREPNFGTVSAKPGVPNFGASIRNKKYPSEKENSSSPTRSGMPNFKPVIDALFERTGKTDIEAARMIAKSCTEINSDIRLEEIARMVRGFDFPKSISNPTGLLIRTLASRCAPETLELYRRRWAEEEEQTARLKASERQEKERVASMVLQDPDSDEESREWARGVLGA